jgi:hypothetical protein
MNTNVLLLLDEPDLTPAQMWVALGKMGQDARIVIALDEEQANRAVRRGDDFEPHWLDSEAIIHETLAHTIRNEYDPANLSVIQDALRVEPGIDAVRDCLIECANALRAVRQGRGVGAMCDGRPYDSTLVRNRLLHEETLGQTAFRKLHPPLSPELDEMTFPKWLAEVRALGRAEFDAGVQELRDHMAKDQ